MARTKGMPLQQLHVIFQAIILNLITYAIPNKILGTLCQNLLISASTTDSFKNKLDKFWSNQALICDYKAELTGIGSRSFITSYTSID